MKPTNLKVFNTLSKQKEKFTPQEEGQVKIYVCGVTPYNQPHIGNARPFIFWDVVRRYLEYLGYKVYHVQNFTDIDDKIIKTAKDENTSWQTITNRYIAAYFEVMDKLGVRRAHNYPKVSEHIDDIIELVKGLVQKGYAYRTSDGSVYFSVDKFSSYGKLSGRSIDDMQNVARVESDEEKRHPMDFALWKAAKPDEASWKSPWGNGRPGWHIECSAMSNKYLGFGFDFHGGGSDLIFPHHENEIAQSEAYAGCEPFVRYWLHNGFVTVDEEKMSKSLGNFFLITDILKHFSPEVLRFFILSTHYRSQLDFSNDRLEEAGKALERLKTAMRNLERLQSLPSKEAFTADAAALLEGANTARSEFFTAMDDDFNTSLAIGHMFNLAKEINIYYQKTLSETFAADTKTITTAAETYTVMANILGILNEPLLERSSSQTDNLVAGLMDLIIAIRQDARAKKDWQTSDDIRGKLSAIGIVLEDSPQGATWKKQ
ncbi:MAG: cysteine--tRNA ligase [Sporomusaceae bacterium]|jgi:cysteinyl-tRNA synthetase|nr:cysteine--tRNA ligase [Sporomusaceae bacterium]